MIADLASFCGPESRLRSWRVVSPARGMLLGRSHHVAATLTTERRKTYRHRLSVVRTGMTVSKGLIPLHGFIIDIHIKEKSFTVHQPNKFQPEQSQKTYRSEGD